MTPVFAIAFLGCADPVIDPREEATDIVQSHTQYDLLAEIVEAETSGSVSSINQVRNRWQGKRYRWEVSYLPQLCNSPHSCNVVPFDGAKLPGVLRQGWLPKLDLDAEAFERLADACAVHDPCVLSFEGSLGTFRFSPDDYTRLAFGQVEIVAVRSATAAERWGSSHALRSDLTELRGRAAELRAKGFRPTLAGEGG